MKGLLAALATTALASGCQGVCGTYEFELPESKARDDRIPPRAVELCGADNGTTGLWDPSSKGSVIAFQPDDVGLDANFVYTNMLITVAFRTELAVDGATLTGNDLGGNAFYGLGGPHSDEAPLIKGESTLTFHRVGAEEGEEGKLFRHRTVDVSWDLLWRVNDSRWAAKGRDEVRLSFSTR